MNGGTRQFVSFGLAGGVYGLDIRIVKEVNPDTRVTAVPRSSKRIRGVVNIRGQVVLVIDVAVVFGREPLPVTGTSHIIILKTSQEIRRVWDTAAEQLADRFANKPVGFLVDRIGDVITVDGSQVAPAPSHLSEVNARYVEGVVRLRDGLLVVLDAAEIL